MFRRLFTVISGLQVLSLAGFAALVVVLARIIHHQTDKTFMPFWDYVGSFQIAFPPIAIVAATYAVAFLAGKKMSDVPALTVSFLRNRFFQSRRMMSGFLLAVTASSAIVLWHTEITPPPAYERLVSAILASEIDRSEEAGRLMRSVAASNPAHADQLALVQRVFELRRQRNLEATNLNLVEARLLLRALNRTTDDRWLAHPLRKHALAEAHSLLAEAMSDSGDAAQGFGELDPVTLFDQSVKLYLDVRDSSSMRLGTPELLASAQNNIGNVHFYKGDYRRALGEWGQVLTRYPEYKNIGTLGNMVAANIVLGEYDAAIRLGQDAKNWAEENGKAITDTAHYVSVLVNTGFAYVANEDLEAALPLFEFAALIENDDNTKLNVAMILAMAGRSEKAERVLRTVSAPVTHRDVADEKRLSDDKRCSYLWWALHSPETDPRDVAARLLVFLGERHSVSELQKLADKDEIARLRSRVADGLGRFPGSCRTYALLTPVVAFVRGS